MEEKQFSQSDAQSRIDQIQAFQNEVIALENDQIFKLPEDQATSISSYHGELLQQYADIYDADISDHAKKLTWGMKFASLFGAFAMAISIFFLFYQFWGVIGTVVQVVILILAPVSMFLLSIYLSQKEKNAYFSKIAALVSLSCFVLNLSMLGQIFNITPSPNAFLIWATFGFLLAYACNARLLLSFAIIIFSSFIAMKLGSWSGMYWINFGERPENFFIPSMVIFMIPQVINQSRYNGFSVIYRTFSLIMIFLPILILSNWGNVSYFHSDYLHLSSNTIEGSYQLLGFILAGFAIWKGIKRQWNEVMNTGNIFFILFLYTKLFDWWWDWLPKYVFFFLLGLLALLALMAFKRLRLSGLDNRKLNKEQGA